MEIDFTQNNLKSSNKTGISDFMDGDEVFSIIGTMYLPGTDTIIK